MLPSFAHQTITILHPSFITERGSEKANYTEPASLTVVEGCILEPLPSRDAQGDREAVLHEWHLMAPPGTVLASVDMVLLGRVTAEELEAYDGQRLGVHGDPQDWDSPTGLVDYIEARVRSWQHGD